MFYLTEGKNIDKNMAKEVIGNEFYLELLEIEDDIKLDKTLLGYFNRCLMANEVLAKHNFFLEFFERRDKFRFLIKKVEGKHKVTRNLSSSVLEKFNGYETIKHVLARQEMKEFVPVDVVYKPIYDESVPVPCFFLPIKFT